MHQVYLASASPPVRFPNVYGVDLPSKKEFVATDLSEEEIRKVQSLAFSKRQKTPLICLVVLFYLMPDASLG